MYNGYKGTAAGCPCNDKKPYKKAEKKRVIKSECTEDESWNPYYPPTPAPCAPCLKPGAGLKFQLIGQDLEPEFSCGSAYLQWQDCEDRCYRALIESEPDLNALQQEVVELQNQLQTALTTTTGTITADNLASVQARLRLALNQSGIYGPCSSSTTVGGFLRGGLNATGGVVEGSFALAPTVNIGPNAIIASLTNLLAGVLGQVGVTGITAASVSQQLCVSCNGDTGVLNTVVALTTNLGTVTLTIASIVAICNTCTDGVSTPTFQILTGNAVVTSTIPAVVL